MKLWRSLDTFVEYIYIVFACVQGNAHALKIWCFWVGGQKKKGIVFICMSTGHRAVNERVCARVFVPVSPCYGGVCRLACHEARGTNPPAPHCRIQVK